MKVLWFSLSPCGSIRRNNLVRYSQGWMISLEDEIKKHNDIDLNVCFISPKREEQEFTFEGVHYYPVFRDSAKYGIMRVWNRFRLSLEDDDAHMFPQLVDVVNKVKPDIIHIHGTEECFGSISTYAKEIHIPVAFSIQGILNPYCDFFFRGLPQSFVNKHEGLKNKILGMSFITDEKWFKKIALRECGYLTSADYILGRTNFDHVITGLFNQNRKYYIVNEILRPEFYSYKWDKPSFGEKITIVSTVSVGLYKGYETLLKAAYLLTSLTKFKFEWKIIGYDSNHRIAKLTHKYLGLDPTKCNITFCGRMDAYEMVSTMCEADIFCQVSHIENSPNSLCEAMLLGMPIVATFAGGTSSLIEDRKEGLLIQDGDAYTMAGTIYELSQDIKKAKYYGEKARERAMIRHDRQGVKNELIEAYNKILECQNCQD